MQPYSLSVVSFRNDVCPGDDIRQLWSLFRLHSRQLHSHAIQCQRRREIRPRQSGRPKYCRHTGMMSKLMRIRSDTSDKNANKTRISHFFCFWAKLTQHFSKGRRKFRRQKFRRRKFRRSDKIQQRSRKDIRIIQLLK